jgi:hypothetical protein
MKWVATLLLAAAAGPAWAGFITDPAGDFLSTYTGPRNGDLDVVSAGGFYDGQFLLFTATMNGPIGTTPGAAYVWGLDRGQGTARFVGGTPSVGAGVLFDSVVAINPNGTGRFTDLLNGANSFNLATSDIRITGATVEFRLLASRVPTAGFAGPLDYTWNLWPRSGAGNAAISDFAPDASNASISAVPVPPAVVLMAVGFPLGLLVARRRKAVGTLA